LCIALCLVACDRKSPTDPPASGADGSPTQVVSAETKEPQPEAEPEPEPEPPPEPSRPKLSDGTVIAECEYEVGNMSCIPGGKFIIGTNDGVEKARPEHEVELQTFYMDIFEVTYKQYKDCVKEGDCPVGGPFYSDFNNPMQAINGQTWIGANKYCQVQGKQLPTEAQWEAAARGPEGETYPWGNDPATCKLAIIKDKRGRSCGVPKKGETPYKGRPFIVGSRPANRYGLYDMAGNSWEYVADWYAENFDKCGEDCLGIDPKGPCDGAEQCKGYTHKMVKGGSWYWEAEYAVGWWRRAQPPNNRPFHHFGFRCAATLSQAKALDGKPLKDNAPTEGMKNADAKLGL
jgi:formylglycine-generating enzyme required for sulfatase activity